MDENRALRIAQRMEALLVGHSFPGRQHRLREMVRDLVETLGGEHAVPEVRARAAPGQHGSITYIVDYCPYCHGTHRHPLSMPHDSKQREAGCQKGEYILEAIDE